jgi:elongation factor G
MLDPRLIRNVMLCGHGAGGKTTMADQFLLLTGAAHGKHSVDDGTSICDFDPEEKNHKYSIEASVVHFQHAGLHFNLVDTPGYPDFIGQAMGAMRGVDLAVIVINAHSGIQVNTRRMFQEAGKAGLPRMIVINRMDDEQIDFAALIASIQNVFGSQCVLLNVPVGQGGKFSAVVDTLHTTEEVPGALIPPKSINEPLLESIVEVDDAVMEKYFEGELPSDAELSRLIVQAVCKGTLVPIVCCSAKTGVGLKEVLDAISFCGPSPLDFRHSLGEGEENLAPLPDGKAPVCAQVFKTRIDPFVQKLSFIRIFCGQIKRDDSVHASSGRKNIKLGPVLRVQADQTSPVDGAAGPGDIVAIAKMEELHTGTSLGDRELPRISFPTPMVSLAVTPKTRGDETKLSGSLHKVAEEDPTFHLDRDTQTKEMVMTGMSELHLGVIRERLLRRDKLEIDTRDPRIPFRETIQTPAEGDYRHKKQSGGRGQFGEVHIRMFPLPRGTNIAEYATKQRFHSIKEYHYDEKNNFLWVDSVVGGVIPGNFMPAIGKGFAERIQAGVIAGYPVQDVCVEVHFGKHHDVDSSEAAFKTAARMAFRDVFQKAKPSLLEPIVKLNITVPEANVGDIYSDMSSRGGRVSGSDTLGGNYTMIHCIVPLREVGHYSRVLSSMTGGMGSYSMEFSHYEVMPSNIQHEVVAKAGIKEEEEE